MPYVSRDEDGEVVEISNSPGAEDDQWLELNDPEILSFLNSVSTAKKVRHALSTTDNEMARVIDDLIDLLMNKEMFTFTELPEAVQAKLNTRKQLRKDMTSLENLIDEDSIF